MSIASRIDAIEQHLTDDYSVLELAGADLTNVDKNIFNLKQTWEERLLYFLENGTDVVWNNWEKVTGSGTSVTLNNTMKGNMRITLNGNTGSSSLPNGYTEVTYIESNGTQYIDTMISSITSTFAIEMDFSITTQQSYQTLYCCRTSNANTRTCFITNLTGFRNDQGNQYTVSKALSLSEKYKLVSTGTEFALDGVVLSNVTTSTAVSNNVRLLSAYPIGSTSSVYPFYGRLYRCKIWDNNILIRDYVPCYRNSDNVIGLYDLVNDVFYTNAGTGTFGKGLNVGVRGNNNIEIECKNIFNPSNFTTKNNVSMTNKGIISSTGIAQTTWDYSNSNWTKTLGAGTYQLTVYFSTLDTNSYPSIRVYNSSGTQLSIFDNLQNITTRTRTITLTEETTIGIMFKLSNGVCTFQIEKGEQATEYMAPQSYPIYLGIINLGLGDKIQGTLNNWEVLRENNTREIITSELLIYQLNDLYQNAKSNDTTTTITQTNEGPPFNLNVVALKEV